MTAEDCIRYYRDEHVRDRIREFLGGDAHHCMTSAYIAEGDQFGAYLSDRKPAESLSSALEEGSEIYRSLWDENSLLADFDIEYVNFDHPAEAFSAPERVFRLLQPLADEIRRTLNHYRIPALQLLSGRGHHFIWRTRRDSDEFRRLTELGKNCRHSSGPGNAGTTNRPASEELGLAFTGIGLVMEFLAHEIKRRAAPASRIPVELTAIEVGPSERGREMLSIDLSEYGDPLTVRLVRSAFSVYLKPWQQRWAMTPSLLQNFRALFVIPVNEISSDEGIQAMRNASAALSLARTSCTKIPDATSSMAKVLRDYEKSRVASFHRWFYSREPEPPEDWSGTYDLLPLEILPQCARASLEQPNDLLLRPGKIRQLTRTLLALGWHPRHIAGLIHSKYARPFGWTQFDGYDRAARADFYTRIFAGAFVAGYDDLVDFNCSSTQQQKLCAFVPCHFNLAEFKQSALNRRSHDQLAHRPFNRLLLQPEHP